MRNDKKRHGVALIIVLVLIVMISLGAYSFTNMMTAQERGTIMAGRQLQAQAAVASGVEHVKDYLALLPEDRIAAGGHWDNPDFFRDVPVSDGSLRFSVVSITQDTFGDPTAIRFGLEDQGSKLNVNTLATSDLYKSQSLDAEDNAAGGESLDAGTPDQGGDQGGESGDDQGGPGGDRAPDDGGGGGTTPDNPTPSNPTNDAATGDTSTSADSLLDEDLARNVLMMLPDMTEQIADSILDWIDEDDTPRNSGAEADDYAALGYEPANGPISSLDELLLVPGITTELLYGADRNHNGILDDNEQTLSAATTGSMARGWSAYLTVNSKDYIQQLDETVDVNGEDLEALFDELIEAGFDENFATYVIAYRQGGAYEIPEIPEDAPDDFELPEVRDISEVELNFETEGGTEVASVLDLIGSMTQVQFPPSGPDGQPESAPVASPYGEGSDFSAILPLMWSGLSTGETEGTGRINSNHCSSAVIGGLPNMDETTAQSILFGQDPSEASGDVNYLYPTWPLATGAVNLEQMKALLPYVSGSGSIFRAQIIGYSDEPGAMARAEVVIDASGDQPVVLSWRDLSHLGPGFDAETLSSQ